MTTSIADWLKQLDLERYTALFVDNEVDLQTLKVLSDADLKEMGLPFGPRKRLLAALQQGHGRPVATPEGERRQLTVRRSLRRLHQPLRRLRLPPVRRRHPGILRLPPGARGRGGPRDPGGAGNRRDDIEPRNT